MSEEDGQHYSEMDEQQYRVSRLVGFCDGAFGFAITLLITTIPFSLGDLTASASDAQIAQQLRLLAPAFFAYVLSFFIVGNYWVVHHRMFRRVIKCDDGLLWINLALLLFIIFLPVPTAYLGRYGDSSLITALYALIQAVISTIYLAMEWYLYRYDMLADDPAKSDSFRYALSRSYVTISLFVLSIGLAFVSPPWAKFSWLAIFAVRPLVLRRHPASG